MQRRKSLPVKRCVMCGEVHELPHDVVKYIHSDEPYVCSRACVLTWIKGRGVKGDDFNWRQRYPYPGFVTDGVHAYYSRVYEMWFGSKYEIQVANWLTDCGLRWKYEEIGFPLGRGRYTPDFYLPGYDVFLEVKGAWVVGKKKKMTRFRDDYSDVDLLVVPWLLAAEFEPIQKGEELFRSGI